MDVTVTKEITFDCAHWLEDYVGPCAELHGHTYKLQVEIAGEINPRTDMIADFSEIKKILQKRILARFDHKCINEVVDYNPTAENMAMDIFNDLLDFGLAVKSIKLWETPTSFVTVTS